MSKAISPLGPKETTKRSPHTFMSDGRLEKRKRAKKIEPTRKRQKGRGLDWNRGEKGG